MKVIEQDLLEIPEGILAHQVNAMGVMGSGIALQIKNKWPRVFCDYEAACRTGGDPSELLGSYQLVCAGSNLWVCNIFGQNDYRRRRDEKAVYTDYGAIQQAFTNLHREAEATPTGVRIPIYVPYKLGCDRGGGAWKIVEAIIDDVCPGVIACRLPQPVARCVALPKAPQSELPLFGDCRICKAPQVSLTTDHTCRGCVLAELL